MKKPAMKPTLKVLEFGGYPFDVLLAVGVSTAQVETKLRRLGCVVDEDDRRALEMNSEGRTVMLKNNALVVRVSYAEDSPRFWAILAHELLHAVFFVMGHVGIRLTDESDEAFTYALQDITFKAHRALKR
jgi:hypothetical protein